MQADTQATFCATLVDEWVRAGVRHAFIAPGSRSTPMALALVRDSRLKCHVVLDERDAGFAALGVGMVSKVPAVVLTTSGTAAVELHPAIVEAHHASVPMIAVTADRPPELHQVGAPQTVDQQSLFTSSTRLFVDPGVPSEQARSSWRSIGSRCAAAALGTNVAPGPVHLNLPFREPLVGTVADLPQGRANQSPWHSVVSTGSVELAGSIGEMLSAKRGVLMVGAGAPDAQAIHELATRLGWPVLADPRSGARISAATTIASADLLMRHDHFVNRATPDVIVQFGRPWASKVLSRWVSECGATRLVVDPFGEWIDEQRSADIFINSSPNDLIQALQRQSLTAASPDWLATWSSAEDAAQKVIHDLFDDEASLSEPGIARTLARSVASGSSVVLSSSMPVRDVEWFASPRQGVDYYSNRGANGIDGVVATAVGVAAISSGRTFALLGDLAFLHDSNGLLAAKSADTGPITLVVVDNAGGGIFSFLPQASNLDTAEFELLFGTPQEADIEAVARAFGAEVATVSSADQLLKSLQQPMSNLDVVVVRTDRVTNVVKHAEAVERVGQALNNL